MSLSDDVLLQEAREIFVGFLIPATESADVALPTTAEATEEDPPSADGDGAGRAQRVPPKKDLRRIPIAEEILLTIDRILAAASASPASKTTKDQAIVRLPADLFDTAQRKAFEWLLEHVYRAFVQSVQGATTRTPLPTASSTSDL